MELAAALGLAWPKGCLSAEQLCRNDVAAGMISIIFVKSMISHSSCLNRFPLPLTVGVWRLRPPIVD